MHTIFIALGLVAAALAAPLADVQETADEPPPNFGKGYNPYNISWLLLNVLRFVMCK